MDLLVIFLILAIIVLAIIIVLTAIRANKNFRLVSTLERHLIEQDTLVQHLKKTINDMGSKSENGIDDHKSSIFDIRNAWSKNDKN